MFAGLFFFPILLSAILHFVLKSFHFQSRNIVLASFGFTAIFFSLIKTVPFFNDFVEELFSIQIILDPSDLIALIMLPLAWRLREKVKNESKSGFSNLSYIVLGIASLATIATSPPVIPIIYNLTIHEKTVYAEFNDYYGMLEESYYFYSRDGGKTWQEVDFELPSEVTEQTGTYPELPFTLCLSNNENVCYQTGTETILESQDGGKTWATSWEFPLGRREFFKRISSYIYLGPYDIVYIELDGKQIVIVSMGSEGVLVKENNSEWESIKVDTAGSIYFSAKDFKEANNILRGEFLILSIVLFIYLYINVLLNIKNRRTKEYYLLIVVSCICILIPILFYIAFLMSSSLNFLPHWLLELLINIFQIILGISIMMVIILTPYHLFTNSNRQAKLNLIPFTIIIFVSYSLFILWAYGTILVYETALFIAVSLYIFLLLWILYLPIKDFIQAKISRSKPDLHE
jgi:hypothetical protein